MGCKMKIPTEIFFIAYKFLFFSSKWQKKYFRKFVETKNARKSSTGDINPNNRHWIVEECYHCVATTTVQQVAE
jgi:hypothetical protein